MSYEYVVLCLFGIGLACFLLIWSALILTRRESEVLERNELARNHGGGTSDDYSDFARLPRNWR